MSVLRELAIVVGTLAGDALRAYLERRRELRRRERMRVWTSVPEPLRAVALGDRVIYISPSGSRLGAEVTMIYDANTIALCIPGGDPLGPLRRGARPGWEPSA